MKKSFYNTISESGQTLIQFNAEAKTQEDMVIEVFRSTNQPLAWFEVAGFLHDMNEVSLKRAISTLKKKGILHKTDVMVTGIYGKQTHKYTLIK